MNKKLTTLAITSILSFNAFATSPVPVQLPVIVNDAISKGFTSETVKNNDRFFLNYRNVLFKRER